MALKSDIALLTKFLEVYLHLTLHHRQEEICLHHQKSILRC